MNQSPTQRPLMRSTIVISDVHGSTIWKEIAGCRRPEERVVFLGDYFDRRGEGPFARSQLDNFRDICAYARAHPHTYLLLGNHDIQYLPFRQLPSSSLDPAHKIAYGNALATNNDILQMVYVDRHVEPPVLYSHGGVTRTFCENTGVDLTRPEELNELWLDAPELFGFIEREPVTGAYAWPDGDSPWEPPTWVRNNAMQEAALPGFNQVTGHTPVRTIAVYPLWWGGWCVLTCTLSEEYLRVESGGHWTELLVENCVTRAPAHPPVELEHAFTTATQLL